MSRREVLQDVGVMRALEDKLRHVEEVKRFDTFEHDEASTLTHAFHDLERGFGVLLDKHFPRLVDKGSAAELNNVLLDIGEELRHILYHIRDPAFYRYLVEDPDAPEDRPF